VGNEAEGHNLAVGGFWFVGFMLGGERKGFNSKRVGKYMIIDM
jgi:hypothetical protein